jgi:hypothetical protein
VARSQGGAAKLNAKQTPLIKPIGRHADHKSDADVPYRKGAGDHQDKAVALFLRYIASPEGKLGTRQKKE